jgi:predicted O-methyltransferase YrrM
MKKFKQLIFNIIQKTDLDKKSMANRLQFINCKHYEASALLYNFDFIGRPTDRLIQIFSQLVIETPKQSNNLFKLRKNVPGYAFNYYGEHYSLLQALVKIIDAKNIIEIGTYTGLSALSFLQVIEGRSLVTVDLVEWDKISNTVLQPDDFINHRFKQIIADFSDFNLMQKHSDLFLNADLIFCDGPKDGSFEKIFLMNLKKLGLKDGCILVFDDIRQWNMIPIWYKINLPKLDATSVGHFTGTGLIEWNNSQRLFND